MAELRRSDEAIEWIEGGLVYSRVLFRPGPTHTLLDVLAALACDGAARSRGPIVILGFAAGGIVPPLRALGYDGPVIGVDIDVAGAAVFEEACGDWAGDVEIVQDDAVAWLERDGVSPACIVDDLSCVLDAPVDVAVDRVPDPDAVRVSKPFESIEAVPRLAASRLAPDGAFVSNLLPWPGASWESLLGNVTVPFAVARCLVMQDYENRLVIAGPDDGDAPAARIDRLLAALDSRQRGAFQIEAVPRS